MAQANAPLLLLDPISLWAPQQEDWLPQPPDPLEQSGSAAETLLALEPPRARGPLPWLSAGASGGLVLAASPLGGMTSDPLRLLLRRRYSDGLSLVSGGDRTPVPRLPGAAGMGVRDTTAPLLLSSSPASGATGVTTGSNILFTFNEAIVRGSGSIEIRSGSVTGSLFERFDAASSTRLSLSGSSLSIDPSKTLSANTRYFVILPAGSIRDAAGNAFAGTSSTSFWTVDTRAPVVSSFSPVDGSSGVSVSSNIVLSFNEAIQRGSGLIRIRRGSSTGTVVETIDAATSTRLSISGSLLTLDPLTTLAGGTRYFITFAAGTIRDLAGNAYAGTSSHDFTTAPADTVAPVVSSTAPLDGAAGIAVDSNLVFTFNEAIQRGSGTLQLRRDSASGTLVESFDAATSSALTIAGSSLTINPTADLATDSRYVLVIPSGAIRDLAGNAYAGTSSYDFTTPDTQAPTLTSLSPVEGATNVSPGSNIVLLFNEAIKPGSGLIELRSGSASGTLVESFAANSSSGLSWSGSQLTINPSNDLALDQTYVVVLPAGSVLDQAGNAFAGLASSSFTTGAVFDAAANPLYAQQWHLRNSGQSGGLAGVDVRAEQAWAQSTSAGLVLGSRATIAIVDDGLQWAHPDLQANYLAAASYDYNFNDADPSPGNTDAHGTSCAGVAAAVGDNTLGVSGIAPKARLSGIRLIAAGATDSQEGQALNHALQLNDIYSNSWGPADSGRGLDAIGPAAKAALANGFSNGRGGKGALYFWAGGNGRGNFDNSNYDGYANSKYVIAVGAIADSGKPASYSEQGANLLVSAPSSGGSSGIVTTDLMGSSGYGGLSDANYTNQFGGTSSATPLAAGVAALILDANPELSGRDVMHILVQSARKVDASAAGWVANGAGRLFNHDYGFGMVDAGAAVSLARTWTSVAPLAPVSTAAETVNLAIPDVGGGSLVRTLNIQDNLRIEAVEVLFNASHTWRGDLEVKLTSPSGSTSFLALQRNDSNDNYSSWQFSSRQHWDELSQGTWTLTVTDRVATDVGTLHNWGLTITGTAAPAPAPGLAPTASVEKAVESLAPTSSISKQTDKAAEGGAPLAAFSPSWAAIDPQLANRNPGLHAYLASLSEAISQGRASLDGVSWTVATYDDDPTDKGTGKADPLTGLPLRPRIPSGLEPAASAAGHGPVRQFELAAAPVDRAPWLAALQAALGESVAFYYPNLPLQQTSRSVVPGFGDGGPETAPLWAVGADPLA
jgi:subtilisin-like proprotein convertase family protein/methionine-rich copper-binding protein CopC